MKTKRIYYYSDPINDDFAGTNIDGKPTPSDWQYIKHNIFSKIIAFIVYRLILTPIVFFIVMIGRRYKVVNKKALKKVKGGYYLYGNHTCILYDAMNPSLLVFPKKNYLICNPDAICIKGIRNIVRMGGALPLPSDAKTICAFNKAQAEIIKKGNVISIFPEAHIWPFYEDIRPYSDASFKYPVMNNAPMFVMTSVYKQRKLFKNMSPRIVSHIDGPYYIDPELSEQDNKKMLRDIAYNTMKKHADSNKRLNYYEYKYVPGVKPHFDKVDKD